MKLKKNNIGFTLFEMVLGITLIGIISGITALSVNMAFRMIGQVQDRKTVVMDGASALNKFSRDFRSLYSYQTLLVCDSKKIRFQNSYGLTIQYQLATNRLYRLVVGAGTPQVMAQSVDVSSSSITYYDHTNEELDDTPLSSGDREKVWRVKLMLNMKNNNNTTVLYTGDIFPENLKLVYGVE